MNGSNAHHVKMEAVDWRRVFPVLRVFGLFHVAMQPTKLLLAWVLVVSLYVIGAALAWVMNPTNADGLEGADMLWAWVSMQTDGLWKLVDAVTSLDLGLDGDGGVLPQLQTLLIDNPKQMWRDAPAYLIVMGLVKFVLSTLIGLAIARLAVLQLARSRKGGLPEAAVFVGRKGVWALAAPLLPMAVVIGLGLALMVAGFVLFNVPVLDVVGGLAYGPLLFVGLVVGLILVVLALAVHLFTASIAAEGTDAFDAVSRCFAYVSSRPWQVLGYAGAALVYGAITFLVVGGVVALGAWVCDKALSAWVLGETWAGGPEQVVTGDDGARVVVPHGGTTWLASWLIHLWRNMLLAVPAAYAVSFYFSAAVQVYLLVRESADGSAMSDCYDPQAKSPGHAQGESAEGVGDAD